jgi:hypothetical protein
MSAAKAPERSRPLRAGHVEAWRGGYRTYDLVKEFVVALLIVALATVALAVVFGSPDDQPVTLQRWANADAADFLVASVSELNYTSEVAGYGAPYTNTPDVSQKIGPINLQSIPGVRIPIDTAKDFVLQPLATVAQNDPALASALSQYDSAPAAQRTAWTDAYTKGLDQVTFQGGQPVLPAGDYGPVATMMAALLGQARGGGLDGALLSTKQFYQTDYTKPVLYISGGSYFEDQATARHLTGSQWGMMNETGNWPGQPWLWLYTVWYQIKPFSESDNADAEIWVIMILFTLLMVVVPFVPGLRSIPQKVGVYRLIWRHYYRGVENPSSQR